MSLLTKVIVGLLFLTLGALAPLCLHAQVSVELERLFERFQSPDTTDAATQELMTLGKSDAQALKYLAARLPMTIEKRLDPKVWANAVQVAGQLKIAEAAPALARWLNRNGVGTITLSGTMQLRNDPAARALVAIGDPSVAPLAAVMRRGNLHVRETAAIALYRIGTPTAQRALRGHAKVETDPRLRDFILKSLVSS